ncbi:hypothetical protein GALMADRAFT_259056 [Galerina marginata CBS 339.88]|uniref:Cytochrome P450 n=1 Tax=Galerina marginata (strain CBS 339.88) TaxID=685588 RepID=A0A067SFP4_GALM3|nr:hypothetical protein GALMADRAFT_259056 [Galerina marginata CBS 339.88]
MTPTPKWLDLFVLLATFAFAVVIRDRKKRLGLPYPPGPRKLPLLGNLLDLPTSFEWETYTRWGKEYNSDVIHLTAAGNDLIIINSFKAAIDLLEKRSSIYSSRPRFTMVTELMGWEWFIPGMPYGEPWRERRRAFAKYFHAGNTTVYQSSQTEFVRKMLPRLLTNPADFLGITQHAIGGMALSLAYGLPIKPTNDPFVSLSQRAVKSLAEAGVPGAFFVDILPFLKYVPAWLPGAGFQRKAREWKRLQVEMREVPYEGTVKDMAAGVAKPSFTSTSLQQLDESGDEKHRRDVIRDTAAIIFAAGADTSVAGLHTFFLAMLCFPHTQAKAQRELDRVLKGRLPEFGDEKDLPYVGALVREVLRWQPILPIGIPHCTTEEDVYNGYRIPKGALVVANAWAMLHDEHMYPDPSTFKPDRFLSKDGQLDEGVRDPSLMAFGFGRRLCPGIHVGQSMLWLAVASILSTFEISQAVGGDGRLVEPEVAYHSALICHPKPFGCTLKPRSKEAEGLIRAAGDAY